MNRQITPEVAPSRQDTTIEKATDEELLDLIGLSLKAARDPESLHNQYPPVEVDLLQMLAPCIAGELVQRLGLEYITPATD